MTVCIAAACFSTDRPAAIVLCSDKRIETEYLAADIGHKLEVAGPRWVAMVSGTVFRAKQLISCYRNHLTPDVIASMSEHNVQGVLQEAPIQQKLNLIEEYFQTRWAISYGDFKETGKDFFPSDIYARIVLEIEQIHLDCDLILAGFIDIVPQILVAARDASVAKRDWFAAVGNGALIAESALYRRQYVPDLGLDEALYRVYEAKKLSEVSPGVGPATHMFIIWALPSDPGLSFVREGYINSTLDPWFKRFGPRKIPALKRHTLDEILINPPEQQSPLETKDDP